MSVPSPRISSSSPLLLIGSHLKKCVFPALNCWLNLVASCLDNENEIPLKVITLFSASRFALPSIPLIVLHSLVTSVFASKVSTKSQFLLFVCVDAVLDVAQIPIIGEAKFLGLLFDSKLSFIPHITSLKSRCTKSLDLIKVLSNTTWGADRKVLLRLYRALIRSKLDYGCIVYGSARPSYIKRLDTVHNQGLRLCLGAFRTSPVQSLYVEANEPPLGMRRTRLSLQYCVKLLSNEVNPAYSAVFQPPMKQKKGLSNHWD